MAMGSRDVVEGFLVIRLLFKNGSFTASFLFTSLFYFFSKCSMGNGCGSVGRAVVFDTRGPQFESSHWQKFIYTLNICLLSTVY